MDCSAQRLSYQQTGYFSKLVTDYLSGSPNLRPFYRHNADINGIRQAILERQAFNTNRQLLVDGLMEQYNTVSTSAKVLENINSLLNSNSFTVITAHQPNLFTGPLYFIYKIIHAIKLSDALNAQIPEHRFVPVFYMGSEDADMDELAHCYVQGEKYSWNTDQSGAFGRMVCDDQVQQLVVAIAGQVSVLPNGEAWVKKLQKYYAKGASIKDATFALVNDLFAEFGLVVVIPDNTAFKRLMIPVFEEELFQHNSAAIVGQTSAALEQHYKVQATGRDINLFYLDEDLRERIEATDDGFKVVNTTIRFTADEMRNELYLNPERFSPNVMLRGIFQETLLPNIAFIGGGGELAYWMQLKSLFEHYKVPYPLLVLRNSFLLAEKKWQDKAAKLQLSVEDFFQTEQQLMDLLVKRDSSHVLNLAEEITVIQQQYNAVGNKAAAIDPTLAIHAEALAKQALHRLNEMEKKMLRAEKRKFSDRRYQVQNIKDALFPLGNLQERVENVAYFYGLHGKALLHMLYEHSPVLEQEFVILREF